MTGTAQELYERDFYAWTRLQARELRRLAKDRWNGPLDLRHLALEVSDMGAEILHGMESQLERIIEHLLKLQYSPAAEPRAVWKASVRQARREIARRATATTTRRLRRSLARHWAAGREDARHALLDHGEEEASRAIPEDCIYRFEQLLEVDFYPEPWRAGG